MDLKVIRDVLVRLTQEVEMIGKSIIVMASVFFYVPAMGAEWDISVSGDLVVASITGNITYGERQRFVFRKGNCKKVNHIFSTYTTQPVNFKTLTGAVLVIEFNGEIIGAALISAKKFLSGNLLMFNLGTYDKDVLLNHLKANEKISIRFVDGNGHKASDYFDAPYNEWSISEISEAFDNAHRECSS